MNAASPLQTLASPPPAFSADEATDIVRLHYGLDVSARPLVSERDQNFRLAAPDGRRFVLKIANVDEDPAFTDFQIAALRHIEGQGEIGIDVPRIVLTTAGEDRLSIDGPQGSHLLRLVTFVNGAPMEGGRVTESLSQSLGTAVARLGRALAGFRHPGSGQVLLWDMRHALALRELLPQVPDAGQRAQAAACLDDFEAHALPAFDSLRAQVIHHDMNPANVLTDPANPERISGVIDFGDMQHSPLVVDVAVAASYLRPADGEDVLRLVVPMVRAYHDCVPLSAEELSLVFDLVATRLATTVILLHWRRSERGDGDAYLLDAAAAEDNAAQFLARWRVLGREAVSARLRDACGKGSGPAGQAGQ